MHNTLQNHVKLIYAKSPEYNPTSAFYIEGYVQVRSSDRTKDVKLQYTFDGSSWLILSASLFAVCKDNTEIWYFRSPNTYNSNSCSFAIEYVIGQNTYWDNNLNCNYCLAWYSPTKILQNCSVVLDRILRDSATLSGNIVLRNISYKKQVTVIYSIDDWKTSKETEACFDTEMSGNLENWLFFFNVPYENKVSLVIKYVVGGNIFWDNNFGKNYICYPFIQDPCSCTK